MAMITSEMVTKEMILNNVRIGLQKSSDEDIIKRKMNVYPDLESYMFIIGKNGNENLKWFAKLKKEFLVSVGISEDEAWEQASVNTKQNTEITDMLDMLVQMGAIPARPQEIPTTPTYVITNKETCRGAGSIVNIDLLKDFAKSKGYCGLTVVPSSIHECLLLPIQNDSGVIDEMIQDINETQVAPNEVLSDHSYVVMVD